MPKGDVTDTRIIRGRLFGPAGRETVFSKAVLDQYLDEKQGHPVLEETKKVAAIQQWIKNLDAAGSKPKEGALEQSFNQEILGKVLGYRLYPAADATAYAKPPSAITGIPTEPDVVLGEFKPAETAVIHAVVELKPPQVKLDVPQPREGKKTPVEQAFDYGQTILGTRWVLVSDMREIRLYSVESPGQYVVFELARCFEAGKATLEFRRLVFLLHHDYLIEGGDESAVSLLRDKSASRQLEIRDAFYRIYGEIRGDVLEAVTAAVKARKPTPGREEILEATQRLLDRMVFLYYCEDHPNHLIPPATIRAVAEAARQRPGVSTTKVYEDLKALFREVDVGSPAGNVRKIPGYNGELFKEHPIIDHIDLPDTLHDKIYEIEAPGGFVRKIQGAWGLYAFDFWLELSEHLLGHIFEESLSDIEVLRAGGSVDIATKLAERKKHGIYYTTQVLSDFLAQSLLAALLDELAPLGPSATEEEAERTLEERLTALMDLKLADFACGSGAFLVSLYREMRKEFNRLQEAVAALAATSSAATQLSLTTIAAAHDQMTLLRDALFGADLLPQAVEIAKLALWLASARKDERVADLGDNIVVADSLKTDDLFKKLAAAPGTFDGVTGNPPWGGEIDAKVYADACKTLGVAPEPEWDSWELFVLLALYALREGGRMGLVLPDTFFLPEKERTRRIILRDTSIELLHSLGPDWFGKDVRMGTIVLQFRKGAPK